MIMYSGRTRDWDFDAVKTYRDWGVEGGQGTAREGAVGGGVATARPARPSGQSGPGTPFLLLFQCRLSLPEEKECIGVRG